MVVIACLSTVLHFAPIRASMDGRTSMNLRLPAAADTCVAFHNTCQGMLNSPTHQFTSIWTLPYSALNRTPHYGGLLAFQAWTAFCPFSSLLGGCEYQAHTTSHAVSPRARCERPGANTTRATPPITNLSIPVLS